MATLKGQTIAASYQDLVKRADTYSQTGTNIELMDDSGDVQATGLYLESNATTSNVGIGIAAPIDVLHVNRTNAAPDLLLSNYTSGGIDAGDSLGRLQFGGSENGTDFDVMAYIQGSADEDFTYNSNAGGELSFWTQVDGSSTAPSRRMTIKEDGNVGIGTAAPDTLLELKESSNGAGDAVLRLHGHGSNADNTVLGELQFYNADGSGDQPGVVASVKGKSGRSIGSRGELAFYTHGGDEGGEGSSPVERMRIDSVGLVGIGTDSPSTALHVVKDDTTNTGVTTLLTLGHSVSNTADDNIGGEILFLNEASDGNMKNTAAIQAIMTNADEGDSTYDGVLQFRTINNKSFVDAMRIQQTGNVGIGTVAPSTNLHLSSASAGLPALLIENTRNDANGGELQLYNNRGAGNASDDDQAGQITFYALDDADNKELYGWIRGVAADVSSGTEDGAISFTNKVAGSYVEDVLRIDGANVGIGVAAPEHKLDIAWGGYQTGGFALNIGADGGNLATRTNSTTKIGSVTSPHYTNAEEEVSTFWTWNTSTVNQLNIGGGVGGFNSLTEIYFYTGANNTTTSGTERMRIDSAGDVTLTGDLIMADGKGINFAAMTSPADASGMAAETLKDYEEGTWTPATAFPGSGSIAISSHVSTYTKIGNKVFINSYIVFGAPDSPSGEFRIAGLPFTVGGTGEGVMSIATSNMDLTSDTKIFSLAVNSNVYFRVFEQQDNGAFIDLDPGSVASTDSMRVSGFYTV